MTIEPEQSAGKIVMSSRELARQIDLTCLQPEATREEILQVCRQAQACGFHTLCVHGRWLPLVAEQLHGTGVKAGGVVSLPFGADTTAIKVAQAREAALAGADEIDMVADLGAIVEGDRRYLLRQLQVVLRVCQSMRPPVVLKVIIESAALTSEQKILACQVAERAGADFLKTSTGLHPAGGATVDDVRLMKEAAPNCQVKAAGGIRTARQAIAMLEAGATRIGTSAGVRIVSELKVAAEK